MAAGSKLCWWGSRNSIVLCSILRPLGRRKLVILVVWSAVNSLVPYSFSTASENQIWLPQGWEKQHISTADACFLHSFISAPKKPILEFQTLIYYYNEICVCTSPACQYSLYSSLHVFCIGKWIRWLDNLSIKCFHLNISYNVQIISSFTYK